MRKHKSVVAVLLAIMMIFTFMPTMAFALPAAGTTESWNADYTAVTITTTATGESKTYTNVKKTWDSNTGKVTASLDWTDYETHGPDATVDYYDFNASAINVVGNWEFDTFNGAITDAEKKTLNITKFPLVLTKPSYVKDADVTGTGGKDAKVGFVSGTGNLVYSVTYSDFDKTSYEAQSVTLTAVVVPGGEGSGAVVHTEFIGTVPQKTIAVAAQAGSFDQVKVDVDKITKDSTRTIANQSYDGSSHKLVNNEVPGFTVAYKLQNETTKVYEDVSEVTFQNVGTYHAAVVITNTKTKEKLTEYKSFEVKAVTDDAVYFLLDAPDTLKEGTQYDAYDFVEVKTNEIYADKYDKAAVKANKDELMAFFKDAYEITSTPDKYDANYINLKVEEKVDFTDADAVKALKAKHEQLVKNFGLDNLTNYSTYNTTVYFKPDLRDYEIEFKNSATKKTYTTKKNSLTKKKTFTVKATSSSNEPVMYKLVDAPEKIVINKTTGKITVKKGLKKGTYNFKVKAYLPKTSTREYVSETHKIKVVVKKTK
jgi:hypothetical protein